MLQDDEAIPTSSMADIVFLLIIFFMVTSVFNLDRGLEVTLPEMEKAGQISRKGIVIALDNKGEVYLDGNRVPMHRVGELVSQKKMESTGAPVIFKSDRNTKYQKIAEVLDELLEAGVNDISLPVLSKSEE